MLLAADSLVLRPLRLPARSQDPLGAPATLGALGIPDDVVDDNRAAEMALQLRSKSDDVSAATASTPCRINSKVELDKYCDQLSTSDYTCSDYYTQDSQSDALRACFDNGSGTCQAALLDTADRSDARGALNKWCYQLSTSQYTCSDYYTINPHTGATKVCYDSGSSRCVAMPARFDACPQSPPSLPPPPPMPGTFMFGMSSTDALVFDMEASPRQLTKDRAEARANDIRAAIRRVRRKTRMSSPELPDFVEAFEVDLVDPAPQDATPEQQKMHDEYANEFASKEARLRTEYPDHPVPLQPIAHIYRHALACGAPTHTHNFAHCPVYKAPHKAPRTARTLPRALPPRGRVLRQLACLSKALWRSHSNLLAYACGREQEEPQPAAVPWRGLDGRGQGDCPARDGSHRTGGGAGLL